MIDFINVLSANNFFLDFLGRGEGRMSATCLNPLKPSVSLNI